MLVSRIHSGHLQGKIVVNLQKPLLPSLRESEWFCTDSLPEVQDGFYDNDWIFADKTKTARPYKPFDGKVLFLNTELYAVAEADSSIFFMQMNTVSIKVILPTVPHAYADAI
jgi:hypothetical protein